MGPFRDAGAWLDQIERLEQENAELRIMAERASALEAEVRRLRSERRTRLASRSIGVLAAATTMAIGIGAVSALLSLC